MRSKIWISVLAAALLGGTACKKSSTEKTGSEMKKAQENVDDRARDVGKAEDKAQGEVAKEQRKLDTAQIDLDKARADYMTAVKTRLAKIDATLDQLATKTDAKSKDKLAKLRSSRAMLQTKLDTMGTQVGASWDDYKKDVDSQFDALEHDANDAIK